MTHRKNMVFETGQPVEMTNKVNQKIDFQFSAFWAMNSKINLHELWLVVIVN